MTYTLINTQKMAAADTTPLVHLALPKGHMKDSVFQLMNESGMKVKLGNDRAYRPTISVPGFDVKLLKVRIIVSSLEALIQQSRRSHKTFSAC